MPPDWDTLSHSHLFCSINIEAQEKKTSLQNFTLNCQLTCCHSVCSWIVPTLANPAFVLQTVDLLIMKHKTVPIPESRVDKKFNRKKPPEEYCILHKMKYKSLTNK